MPSDSGPTPYKVKATDVGAADVLDRASGRRVGYVLRAYNGWQAYLESQPGWPLPFAWSAVPAYVENALGWKYRPVLHTSLRGDAVAEVWSAHTLGGKR